MRPLPFHRWTIGLSLAVLAISSLAGAAAPAERSDPNSLGPQRLNNLVTELLRVFPQTVRSGSMGSFTNPREGWIFVQGTAEPELGAELAVAPEARLSDQAPGSTAARLPTDETLPVLIYPGGSRTTQEGMRYLPRGNYQVRLRTKGAVNLQGLVVRAIPELTYCKFQYDPLIPPYGPYDWAFVQKHIAANANCIVGSGAADQRSRVLEWKQQGKCWLVECGVPALDGKQPLTADEAYEYWTRNVGFTDSLLDGVIADEFLQNRTGMKYPEWTEAVRRIHATEAWRGKRFYPYCTILYRDAVSAEFLRTVMRGGDRFAWEVYLREQPDEAAAQHHIEANLAVPMGRWRAALTNCAKSMVVCLGYMSLPATETLSINPAVDFKVWMDMQFQHLACEPVFDGLYGLMEYTCGYADEETVRWAARLYRHYGIEGNTNRLSTRLGFKYHLDHIQNPDFADGTDSWQLAPAAPDRMEARLMKGYSWLQGRYPKTVAGNTFLWTKRSPERPNRFSQPIRNLTPGRLYSLKLLTADYGELQQGRSQPQKHAVALTLDGASVDAAKSFQYVIAHNYAHSFGPFNEQNKAWLNLHYRLFRPRGQTVEMSVSDWANLDAPGGPADQELMFNFIEVQPYLEE